MSKYNTASLTREVERLKRMLRAPSSSPIDFISNGDPAYYTTGDRSPAVDYSTTEQLIGATIIPTTEVRVQWAITATESLLSSTARLYVMDGAADLTRNYGIATDVTEIHIQAKYTAISSPVPASNNGSSGAIHNPQFYDFGEEIILRPPNIYALCIIGHVTGYISTTAIGSGSYFTVKSSIYPGVAGLPNSFTDSAKVGAFGKKGAIHVVLCSNRGLASLSGA